MEFNFGRAHIDVYHNGRQARFVGELIRSVFYLSESSMKWIESDGEKKPTEEERESMLKAISESADEKLYEIVFADDQFAIWDEEGKQYLEKIHAQKIRFCTFENGEVTLSYFGKVIRGKGEPSMWGVTMDAKTMEWVLDDGTFRALNEYERKEVIREVKMYRKQHKTEGRLTLVVRDGGKRKWFRKKAD